MPLFSYIAYNFLSLDQYIVTVTIMRREYLVLFSSILWHALEVDRFTISFFIYSTNSQLQFRLGWLSFSSMLDDDGRQFGISFSASVCPNKCEIWDLRIWIEDNVCSMSLDLALQFWEDGTRWFFLCCSNASSLKYLVSCSPSLFTVENTFACCSKKVYSDGRTLRSMH